MADIIACPACGARNRIRGPMRGVPLCGRCKAHLTPPAAAGVRILNGEGFESALRLNPQPMLVDFWASWCQPCRQVAEVLERFAGAHSGITVAKVDIDAEPGLASQYQIFGVPTLILFVKGREVHRISGAMGEAELAAELAPWLGGA